MVFMQMVFMQGLVPRENVSQDTQIGYVVALEKKGVLIEYINVQLVIWRVALES